jgi:hypothetical protein
MDELTEYQHRRLELGDMIRAAIHIACGCRDQGAEQKARQLLARLAQDRFAVAVTGQFSRGKTTLMNALLGAAYLPTGSIPTTSVITKVRYGSRSRATIRRRGSSMPIDVPPGDIGRFVSQSSLDRAELQVVSVDLEAPAEILRLGFEFADTPGVGSAIEANTAATVDFLSEADAVIFVTGFDSPLTEAETSSLADALQLGRKLFLVVNKADLVSPEEAAEVSEFVGAWVGDHGCDIQLQMFGLSALRAVQAAALGDKDQMTRSGVPEFRSALVEFLTTQKARASLENIASEAARLVDVQQRNLRLGQLAADGLVPAAISADFDAGIEDLLAQERAVTSRIAARISAELPDVLSRRGPGWRTDLAKRFDSTVRDLAADGATGTPESLRRGLETSGREITGDWLNRRAGEVLELLIGIAAGDIATLRRLVAAPQTLGATMAGLPAAAEPSSKGWPADDIPPLAVQAVPWYIQVAPPRRRGGRMAPSGRRVPAWLADAIGMPTWLADAVEAAVCRFEGQAREALQEASLNWAEHLGGQAERETTAEADQFRCYLRTPPYELDVAAVAELAARLAGFQAVLDRGDAGRHGMTLAACSQPDTAVAGTAATVHPGGCQVCRRIEEVLAERLRHDQFRLATRAADQSTHAESGGFCPLHTWQYATIASPLGISAGYANLAAAAAAALESHADSPGPADELSRAVTSLADGCGCSICGALADCEASTLARLTEQPLDPNSVTLCLRHLGLVLAAPLPPDASRALLHALARALRRTGEDMRSFALKREALQGALVTQEESNAYEDALRLLAGHAALAVAHRRTELPLGTKSQRDVKRSARSPGAASLPRRDAPASCRRDLQDVPGHMIADVAHFRHRQGVRAREGHRPLPVGAPGRQDGGQGCQALGC